MLKNIVNVARNALAHPLGGQRPLATLGRIAVWQLTSSICGARTWAFERDPTTINNLSANIDANGIGSLARVIPTALGAENGEIGFTIGLDAANHVAESADVPQPKVEVGRLDDIVGGETPTMIKINVGGHEAQVFAAADAVLAKSSLHAIEIETLEASILGPLTRHEFVERFYDPFRRLLSDVSLGEHAIKRLFIRNEAFVLERVRTAPSFYVAGFSI